MKRTLHSEKRRYVGANRGMKIVWEEERERWGCRRTRRKGFAPTSETRERGNANLMDNREYFNDTNKLTHSQGKWWSTTIPTDSSHSSHKHEEEEPPTLSPFSSTESQSIVLFNTLTPTSTNSLNSKSTVSQHRTMISFTDSRQIDELHKIGRKNDDDKV